MLRMCQKFHDPGKANFVHARPCVVHASTGGQQPAIDEGNSGIGSEQRDAVGCKRESGGCKREVGGCSLRSSPRSLSWMKCSPVRSGSRRFRLPRGAARATASLSPAGAILSSAGAILLGQLLASPGQVEPFSGNCDFCPRRTQAVMRRSKVCAGRRAACPRLSTFVGRRVPSGEQRPCSYRRPWHVRRLRGTLVCRQSIVPLASLRPHGPRDVHDGAGSGTGVSPDG